MGFIAPIALAIGGAFAAKKIVGGLLAKETPKLPEQAAPTATAATVQEDAKAKSKADMEKRRRISMLSGGNTDITKGTAGVSGDEVAKKTLLGQ